ncbi:hypothetical protein CCR80_07015, partial [Rhodothalassium salexigens]|uniref:HugZ family pyridoxamine 5'-phosphate oxidase n=2 Tax=Rhodothalassium salexigens TaxID=1086 RepID=UPI0019139B26
MADSADKELLQSVDAEARRRAKTLIRTAPAGALALIEPDTGRPWATRVGLACDLDGAPVFPMSQLSGRADAVASDPRASLLIGPVAPGDPLAQARITLMGTVRPVTDAAERARLRRRYLARQPKAKLYIDFADFAFWRFEVERVHLVAGFGQAYALSAADVSISPAGQAGLADLAAMEESAVAHMNADHGDAVALYAERLLGAPPGRWQVVGIDPDGLDLRCHRDLRRLDFDQPLTGSGALKATLAELARRARAMPKPASTRRPN